MPIDSIPLPADGLDSAIWAGAIVATVFVLSLRWALEFTARRPEHPALKRDADEAPGLTAEQAERIRRRM